MKVEVKLTASLCLDDLDVSQDHWDEMTDSERKERVESSIRESITISIVSVDSFSEKYNTIS